MAEDELVEVSVQDRRGWILREDYDRLAADSLEGQVVRLLPSFDPYMLGHADKNHLVDVPWHKRVYRNAGWISPVVLLNGKAVGAWSYARRGSHLVLEIQPFQKYSRRVRAKIEEEAASLGCFLEASLELRFGEWVPTRGHCAARAW